MKKVQKAALQLHLSVLLFGFSAILGALISLEALPLVWWRVVLTSLSFLLFFKVLQKVRKISTRRLYFIGGIGCIVALHWVLFFASIKFANASIGVVCMATTSFFTALIEPLFFKRKVEIWQVAMGLLMIPGMMLISKGLDSTMMFGLLLGILSAIFLALFTVLNKDLVATYDPVTISFIELSSASACLSLILPVCYFYQGADFIFWPSWSDLGYLLALAIGCTTIAYVLFMGSLKYISAFYSNLTMNLEPIYGILLATLILKEHEQLNLSFYLGAVVIILSIFVYPILRKRTSVN